MKSLRRRAAADTNELHPSSEENRVALSTEVLEQEREALRTNLREIEDEQRTIEASLKIVRQRELRIKREIEALSTLIDLAKATLDEE